MTSWPSRWLMRDVHAAPPQLPRSLSDRRKASIGHREVPRHELLIRRPVDDPKPGSFIEEAEAP
jgi:hypothetical protein